MREAFARHFSHFFNKKYWQIADINISNFNEMLTNDVVSFEQLGPDLVQNIREGNKYTARIFNCSFHIDGNDDNNDNNDNNNNNKNKKSYSSRMTFP